MADPFCPPTTDDRGRSSDDPCNLWCGGGDYDAWKKKAQERLAQALMREDLPPGVANQLRDWQQQVELLPRSKIDSGDAVRLMASIARQAECVALAKPAQFPPLIQVEKKQDWYKRKEVWILIAVVIGGGFLMTKLGILSALSKRVRRAVRGKK